MSDIVIGQQLLSYTLGEQNNSVLVNIGDILSGDSEAAYCQYYQQVGFCSLPPAPIPGVSAAEVLLLKHDDGRKIVFGTRHPTSQAMYANMSPGDTIMYGAGSDGNSKTRIKCAGATKTVALMTSDGTSDVQMAISATAWTFFAPFGKFIFDATGLHVTTIDGASFHLGSVSGLPTIPGVNLNSMCTINADIVRINGNITKLGAGTTYAPMIISTVGSPAPLTPIPHPDIIDSSTSVPITAVTTQTVLVAIS